MSIGSFFGARAQVPSRGLPALPPRLLRTARQERTSESSQSQQSLPTAVPFDLMDGLDDLVNALDRLKTKGPEKKKAVACSNHRLLV